jgi:hypothetical protein
MARWKKRKRRREEEERGRGAVKDEVSEENERI